MTGSYAGINLAVPQKIGVNQHLDLQANSHSMQASKKAKSVNFCLPRAELVHRLDPWRVSLAAHQKLERKVQAAYASQTCKNRPFPISASTPLWGVRMLGMAF